MANEKILNTRVQLKYDTLANWNASTFIPKKGEVCIATVDTAQKDLKGNIITVPTLLIKVGSGEANATFSTLPFVSAPAADVYDWAKKSEADFVAGFLSMPGMQDLLNGVFATDAEVEAAVADLQGQINAINTKLGDLSKLNTTYKTDLVGAINEALQAVEVGGTGSVVSVIVTDVEGGKSYQVTQGGNNVGSAIVVPNAYDDAPVKANTEAINAIKDGTSIDSFKDVEDALAGKQAAGDYATNTALNAVKATAEAAYVKPVAGIGKEDLAADVQTSLGKADTALQAHQDISHLATKTELTNGLAAKADATATTEALATKADKTTVEGISEKVTALEGKVDTEKKVSEAIADALQAAKDYADENDADTQYDDTKVKEDITANATAISEEIDRAKTAEAKALTDAKAYTDQEINKITTGAGYATTKYVDDAVAAHETAVNKKLADYSTTEQMNAAIDADVLVETNRATGAEEALAGRIKALEDVSHDFAGADAALKAELQAEIDADVKALADGAVKANTEAIAAINDTENGILATAKAYTDKVKATILGENDKLIETYDTLSEIGQWIENTGSDVTDLATAIANEAKAREDADTAINEAIASVKATAEAAQTADEVSDAIDAKIEALDLANTYQAKGEYATADQGALADTALQAADITAGPTYGAGENDNGSAGMDILVKGTPAASLVMTAAKDGGLKIDNQASGASHQVIGAIALTDEAKASLEKADSALQEITTTANGGLKVTNKNQIDIDDSVVFVFDCGSATENIG